jgi:hypothetical protein
MPAAAPDDGLWRPAQPVAYAGGRGSATAAAVGGGQLIDPSGAIQNGYNQQLAYQQASIANLLAAFRSSDGLAATKHALAAAVGINNFGQVQGQGADVMNQGIAGITGAGINADASDYQQQQANARTAAEIEGINQRFEATPQDTGGRPNPLGPFYPNLPEKGLPRIGGMPVPVGATADRQDAKKFIPDGAQVTQGGVTYVRQNGQWARKD